MGPVGLRSRRERENAGVKAKWLGLQSPRDTLRAISGANVLAHPSPVEIFGNVLAEAMALGTPIVAMRAGGNTEILGDDGSTAVLIDEDRPELFANGIAELRANPVFGRGLAAAARKRLIEVFPLNRMIESYETMMQHLVRTAAVAE